jgi:hypothetical protein
MHDDIIARVEQIAASQWQATEGQEPTEPAPPSFEAAEDEINEVVAMVCKILKEEFEDFVSYEPISIVRCNREDADFVVYVAIGTAMIGSRHVSGNVTLYRPRKGASLVPMEIEPIMKRKDGGIANLVMRGEPVMIVKDNDDDLPEEVLRVIKAISAHLASERDEEPALQVEELPRVLAKLSLLGRARAWLRRHI